VTSVSAAYRLWSASYDRDPNPLLALEQRVLSDRLEVLPGERVIDLATGTGRWLLHVLGGGGNGFGVDNSPEMLAQAAKKRGIAGRLICADALELPFPDGFADLAICSFALGYISPLDAAIREMARVARRIVLSDLHPNAVRAGWVRSFRTGGQKYEISHFDYSKCYINACARNAGLAPLWSLEAKFGEPEREIFERAGKGQEFESTKQVPAIFVGAWERQ